MKVLAFIALCGIWLIWTTLHLSTFNPEVRYWHQMALHLSACSGILRGIVHYLYCSSGKVIYIFTAFATATLVKRFFFETAMHHTDNWCQLSHPSGTCQVQRALKSAPPGWPQRFGHRPTTIDTRPPGLIAPPPLAPAAASNASLQLPSKSQPLLKPTSKQANGSKAEGTGGSDLRVQWLPGRGAALPPPPSDVALASATDAVSQQQEHQKLNQVAADGQRAAEAQRRNAAQQPVDGAANAVSTQPVGQALPGAPDAAPASDARADRAPSGESAEAFGSKAVPQGSATAPCKSQLPSSGASNQAGSTSRRQLRAPKIALLFLTLNHVPHEALWRAFFEAAARLRLRTPPPPLLPPFNLEAVADGKCGGLL